MVDRDWRRDESDPDLVLAASPDGWEARAALGCVDLCGRGSTAGAALRDVAGRVRLLADRVRRVAALAERRALRQERSESEARVEVVLVPADRSPGPRSFPPRDGWVYRLRDVGAGGVVLVFGSAPDRAAAVRRGLDQAESRGFRDVRVVDVAPTARPT